MQPFWMDPNVDGAAARSPPGPPARSPAEPRHGSSSLLRSLFSLHAPPNEVTKMHDRDSFSQLPFVGGEEEAQDHWHDKWEAHRRTSLDEADRAAEHRSMVRAMTTHAGTKTKAVAAGLAAPGEVYKTAAAAPLRPKPATTATSTTQDDPWRAVFNPGRNMNMRAVGASKFDKPVAGDGKSVNHHLLQSQSAAAAPAAKKEDGSVNAEDIYKSTYWG